MDLHYHDLLILGIGTSIGFLQPRDYMTTFMLLGMIIGAVVGVVVAHPAMQLNAFNGFVLTGADGSKSYLFRPYL